MPRFFFHVHDGKNIPDEDGTELADYEAARIEAVEFAGRIVAEDALHIGIGADWHMEVTNRDGLVLYRLDFHLTASPAVRDNRLVKEKVSLRQVSPTARAEIERSNQSQVCLSAHLSRRRNAQ